MKGSRIFSTKIGSKNEKNMLIMHFSGIVILPRFHCKAQNLVFFRFFWQVQKQTVVRDVARKTPTLLCRRKNFLYRVLCTFLVCQVFHEKNKSLSTNITKLAVTTLSTEKFIEEIEFFGKT